MIVLTGINYWAVLVGAVLYMMFGAFYFSPILFGSSWIRLNNLGEGYMSNPLIYVASTAVAFLSSFLMAILVHATGASGLMAGLSVGLVVALVISLVYLKNAAFGLMSRKVFAIAIGEHIVSFVVLGILHAVWR